MIKKFNKFVTDKKEDDALSPKEIERRKKHFSWYPDQLEFHDDEKSKLKLSDVIKEETNFLYEKELGTWEEPKPEYKSVPNEYTDKFASIRAGNVGNRHSRWASVNASRFSDAERNTVDYYKGDSSQFNEPLRKRGVNKQTDKHVFDYIMNEGNEDTKYAIRKVKHIKNLDKITRNVNPNRVIAYRSIPTALYDHVQKIGSEFTDHGFAGLSFNKATSLSFDIDSRHPKTGKRLLSKIYVPAGMKGHYLNYNNDISHSSEREYLLHRGTRFKVLGHTEHQNHHIVHLGVVGQEHHDELDNWQPSVPDLPKISDVNPNHNNDEHKSILNDLHKHLSDKVSEYNQTNDIKDKLDKHSYINSLHKVHEAINNKNWSDAYKHYNYFNNDYTLPVKNELNSRIHKLLKLNRNNPDGNDPIDKHTYIGQKIQNKIDKNNEYLEYAKNDNSEDTLRNKEFYKAMNDHFAKIKERHDANDSIGVHKLIQKHYFVSPTGSKSNVADALGSDIAGYHEEKAYNNGFEHDENEPQKAVQNYSGGFDPEHYKHVKSVGETIDNIKSYLPNNNDLFSKIHNQATMEHLEKLHHALKNKDFDSAHDIIENTHIKTSPGERNPNSLSNSAITSDTTQYINNKAQNKTNNKKIIDPFKHISNDTYKNHLLDIHKNLKASDWLSDSQQEVANKFSDLVKKKIDQSDYHGLHSIINHSTLYDPEEKRKYNPSDLFSSNVIEPLKDTIRKLTGHKDNNRIKEAEEQDIHNLINNKLEANKEMMSAHPVGSDSHKFHSELHDNLTSAKAALDKKDYLKAHEYLYNKKISNTDHVSAALKYDDGNAYYASIHLKQKQYDDMQPNHKIAYDIRNHITEKEDAKANDAEEYKPFHQEVIDNLNTLHYHIKNNDYDKAAEIMNKPIKNLPKGSSTTNMSYNIPWNISDPINKVISDKKKQNQQNNELSTALGNLTTHENVTKVLDNNAKEAQDTYEVFKNNNNAKYWEKYKDVSIGLSFLTGSKNYKAAHQMFNTEHEHGVGKISDDCGLLTQGAGEEHTKAIGDFLDKKVEKGKQKAYKIPDSEWHAQLEKHQTTWNKIANNFKDDNNIQSIVKNMNDHIETIKTHIKNGDYKAASHYLENSTHKIYSNNKEKPLKDIFKNSENSSSGHLAYLDDYLKKKAEEQPEKPKNNFDNHLKKLQKVINVHDNIKKQYENSGTSSDGFAKFNSEAHGFLNQVHGHISSGNHKEALDLINNTSIEHPLSGKTPGKNFLTSTLYKDLQKSVKTSSAAPKTEQVPTPPVTTSNKEETPYEYPGHESLLHMAKERHNVSNALIDKINTFSKHPQHQKDHVEDIHNVSGQLLKHIENHDYQKAHEITKSMIQSHEKSDTVKPVSHYLPKEMVEHLKNASEGQQAVSASKTFLGKKINLSSAPPVVKSKYISPHHDELDKAISHMINYHKMQGESHKHASGQKKKWFEQHEQNFTAAKQHLNNHDYSSAWAHINDENAMHTDGSIHSSSKYIPSKLNGHLNDAANAQEEHEKKNA